MTRHLPHFYVDNISACRIALRADYGHTRVLRYADLVRHLAQLLRRQVSFPKPWRTHEQGQIVAEGGVIERRGDKFLYRSQRADPVNPLVLAEHWERTFENAEEAASQYLTADLHLPGDLDGWKVIR